MSVVLDNEPIHVLLAGRAHPKHRRLLAEIQYAVTRGRPLVVPTAVRTEAGCDRTSPAAAVLGVLRIEDASLDTDRANAAAAIRREHGVSVADAHVAAVARSLPGCTVLTSDPDDIARATDSAGVTVAQL